MRRLTKMAVLGMAAMSLVAPAASMAATDDLMALSEDRDVMYRVAVSDTGDYALRAELPLSRHVDAIDTAPDGTVYGMDGGALMRIDPATGAITPIGAVSGVGQRVEDIEITADGRSVIATPSGQARVVRADLADPRVSQIVPLSTSLSGIMTIAPNQYRAAAGWNAPYGTASYVELDAAGVVRNIASPNSTPRGLDRSPWSGRAYAAVPRASASLFINTVDVATGRLTPINRNDPTVNVRSLTVLKPGTAQVPCEINRLPQYGGVVSQAVFVASGQLGGSLQPQACYVARLGV